MVIDVGEEGEMGLRVNRGRHGDRLVQVNLPPLFVPNSLLNQLRRETAEMLDDARLNAVTPSRRLVSAFSAWLASANTPSRVWVTLTPSSQSASGA
jgi:hypothetical protein